MTGASTSDVSSEKSSSATKSVYGDKCMIHVVMIRVRLVMSSKSVAVGVIDPKGIR